MQGSYRNNGLPRPYYMKPSTRGSVYDKMPRQVFLTNSKKLTGYIVLFFFFGLCVFMVSQELKTQSDPSYELVDGDGGSNIDKDSGDIRKWVDSANVGDFENDKADLAMNKAQNSKGELGHGIPEAPKGGMVNEAHIVGNDEDLIIDGKTKKNQKTNELPSKGKGFKAEREKDTPNEQTGTESQIDRRKEVTSRSDAEDELLQKPANLNNVKDILDESNH